MDDVDSDERSSSDVDLRPDGSFTIEYVMSNGGGESTVRACVGQIPAAEAATWVARIAHDATLAAPPREPTRQEATAQQLRYRVTIRYATGADAAAYADPAHWARELDPLLARLVKLERCKISTRS